MASLVLSVEEEEQVAQMAQAHDPAIALAQCTARDRIPADLWDGLIERLRKEVECRIKAALITENLCALHPEDRTTRDERAAFAFQLAEVLGAPGTFWDMDLSSYLSDDEETELEDAVANLPLGYAILEMTHERAREHG